MNTPSIHPESDVQKLLGSQMIWAPYKRVSRSNGKYQKVPVDREAAALKWKERPAFWTLEQARADCARLKVAGVGLFTDGNLAAVDLDSCFAGERLFPFAADLVQALPTYWEHSPSGTGLHGLFTHTGFHRGEWVRSIPYTCGLSGRVELYTRRHFLTFTNRPYTSLPVAHLSPDRIEWLLTTVLQVKPQPSPLPPHPVANFHPVKITDVRHLSDAELLRRHDNDPAFRRYWRGDPGHLPDGSRSAIRYALIGKLVFSCGDDVNRAQELAESSPFYASLDKQGRRDWARRFVKDYRKYEATNRGRYGQR